MSTPAPDQVTRWALAAATGDPVAEAAFVRHTQADVWRLAAALVDSQSADDLVRETYLRAFRALPSFEARSTARTWLLGIARRTCADHLRAARAATLARQHTRSGRCRRHRRSPGATPRRTPYGPGPHPNSRIIVRSGCRHRRRTDRHHPFPSSPRPYGPDQCARRIAGQLVESLPDTGHVATIVKVGYVSANSAIHSAALAPDATMSACMARQRLHVVASRS